MIRVASLLLFSVFVLSFDTSCVVYDSVNFRVNHSMPFLITEPKYCVPIVTSDNKIDCASTRTSQTPPVLECTPSFQCNYVWHHRDWCTLHACNCVLADAGETENRASTTTAPRIYLLMPYFGDTFQNYFQMYLDSLERNSDVLTVFLLTDLDLSAYRLPTNLIVVGMTFEQIRHRLIQLLTSDFGQFEPGELLSKPYKLVDFKTMFSRLFEDLLSAYDVREGVDFVGYGDCDLIYGVISDFWKPEHYSLDIIGGYHGHFTAWKNTRQFRSLYKSVPNLLNHLKTRTAYVTEIAFREPLLRHLRENNFKMFYINKYIIDIVPPVFYRFFRSDHRNRTKNWFDAYHAHTDIKEIFYNKSNGGRFTVWYDNGMQMGSVYVHLQKREMAIRWIREPAEGYFIEEHSFTSPADRLNKIQE